MALRRETRQTRAASETPQEGGVSNDELRAAFTTMARVMANQQASQQVSPPAYNQASKLRDFMRMNPPEFHGSKVNEDPHNFIEETSRIVDVMGLTTIEKAELVAYQLKDVARIWYEQMKAERNELSGRISWEEFKAAFLDRFFPLELREAKVQEFINLKQGGLSVWEYSLKFTQLSKYAPFMLSDPRARMSKFLSGISENIKLECHQAMLIKEMDLSRLMVYAEQVEDMVARRQLNRPRASHNNFVQRRTSFNKGRPVPYNRNSRFNKGKGVSNPAPMNNTTFPAYPRCRFCGKHHPGDCRVGRGVCYQCGQPGHHVKDCRNKAVPRIEAADRNHQGGSREVAPRNNRFYAIQARQEVEETPDVVTEFQDFQSRTFQTLSVVQYVMSTSDWSKLPVELLGLIASRLHFAEEWVRFGAVCKSWRICITQNGYSSCSSLPWLMLPQRKHESLRRFYCPFNCKSYDIRLPDVQDKRCWGSSHGWLVTLGANFEMYLLNPLSGAQISLPPLHKCPNLNLICTGKSFRDSFVYKVILSSSPCSSDCVIFAIYSDNLKMAFTKPGDAAWTPLSCIHGHVDDAMCHDGKFYAIDTFGEILIWDLAGSLLKRIAFSPSRDLDNLVYATTYLVEIKGQIYAIMRLLFDTRITDTPCLNTWCFKIYELDVCHEKCEEVKSLDDWSIFVGNNHSFSIPCSAYPECESNCIYFTDDFSGVHYNVVQGYDMGIYDIQNLRVQPLLQEDISDFAFSLPLWIVPSLS